MKINDTKLKLLDSIKKYKKLVCDVLDAVVKEHPDLIEGEKKSLAFELAKRKDEIANCSSYKQLRDIIVECCKLVASQPKAKEVLAKIESKFDKMVARDPRVGGYNEQYWFHELWQYIYNIMLKAENLGSPDVKDAIADDRMEEIRKLHKDGCRFDDSCFKDVEEGTAEAFFVKFMKDLKAKAPSIWTTGSIWRKSEKGSEFKIASFIPETFVDFSKHPSQKELIRQMKEEFAKLVESILPNDAHYELISMQETLREFDYAEFAEINQKQFAQIQWELDEKFGDEYELKFIDDKHKQLAIIIDEDVPEEDALSMYNSMATTIYNLDFKILDSKCIEGKKLTFALPINPERECQYKIILDNIDKWSNKNDSDEVDLIAYTVPGVNDSVEMSLGEKLAEVVAKAFEGEVGPFGGENPIKHGNRVGLESQAGITWYIFNDDGSVDIEPDDESIRWAKEEDEELKTHYDSALELFNGEDGWFYDAADDLEHKIKNILNRGKDMKDKIIKDDEDAKLVLCKLLAEAHDKIMEAQEVAKDLIEADELSSDLEYALDDLEAEVSEFEFMGESDPVAALLEKFPVEEDDDYDWDYEEDD